MSQMYDTPQLRPGQVSPMSGLSYQLLKVTPERFHSLPVVVFTIYIVVVSAVVMLCNSADV